MRVCIVIPAYEPGGEFVPYAQEVLAAGLGPVLVVDDGSGPAYAPVSAVIMTARTQALSQGTLSMGVGWGIAAHSCSISYKIRDSASCAISSACPKVLPYDTQLSRSGKQTE